jgi:hypothetical protein
VESDPKIRSESVIGKVEALLRFKYCLQTSENPNLLTHISASFAADALVADNPAEEDDRARDAGWRGNGV